MSNTLAGGLPELIAAESQLRQLANGRGILYQIANLGGAVRSAADTALALRYREDDYPAYVRQQLAAGRSVLPIEQFRPITSFGNSFHNYGAAFDLTPTKWPGGRTADWALSQLQQLAPSVGLRSGATFGDPPHMELAITLAEAKRRWAARGNAPGQIGGLSFTSIGALSPMPVLIPGVQMTPDDSANAVDFSLPWFTDTSAPATSPALAPWLIFGTLLVLGSVAIAARRRGR